MICMNMCVEDIDECKSELSKEFHIPIDLLSYRINDDGFFGYMVSEDVCVCPCLLIEELTENDVIHN